MIEISGLAFSFPGQVQPFFRNLAIQASAGERIALVGPSGVGKTTLIYLIAGLVPCRAGSIILAGRPMPRTDSTRSRFRNRYMGIVFQNYNLIPALSVRENLELRFAIANLNPPETRLLKEHLDRVAMADKLHAKVGDLSGGQQQRIAAVRALITRPALVLADEPTGNLDDASAQRVSDLLLEPDRERLVVVATHDRRMLDRFSRTLAFEQLEQDP